MAQWNGQYTGNTHLTKVRDCESSLRHAVSVFHDAPEDEAAAKQKAVVNLAEKLHAARIKLLKAKISDLAPVIDDQLTNNKRIERLREQLSIAQDAGIGGILAEFGVKSLVSSK